MQIFEILSLSWRDFLTKKIIILSILPLFCSIVILGVGLFWTGGELGEILAVVLESGKFGLFDLSVYPFIMNVINHKVVYWILGTIFDAFGSYIMLALSILIALIIAGFLTPVVAREINARHYGAKFSPISTSKSVKLMIVVGLKFLALLLVCLPLAFIPVINFIIINVPFFYAYSKFLLIDVGSNTLSSNKFEILWLENGGLKFIFCAFCFYLVSLVPLLGLILQLFFIIFLSHLFFQKETIARF